MLVILKNNEHQSQRVVGQPRFIFVFWMKIKWWEKARAQYFVNCFNSENILERFFQSEQFLSTCCNSSDFADNFFGNCWKAHAYEINLSPSQTTWILSLQSNLFLELIHNCQYLKSGRFASIYQSHFLPVLNWQTLKLINSWFIYSTIVIVQNQ